MPAPSKSDPEALPFLPAGDMTGGFMAILDTPYPIPGGHSPYTSIKDLGKPNLIQGDRWEQPAGNGFSTKVNVGGGFRKFTNDTANKECDNTRIGAYPQQNDLRCYMCGVRYVNPRSRKRDGAECEHVMPFWLLFLLIGINHSSYIKWRDKFLNKYEAFLRGQGVHPKTFKAYQEWLWGGAYKWSCWPCNRLKNNCGYINIDMNTNYRLSVLNGITTSAGLQNDPPDACYTGNINDHFLALMLSTQSYCRSWRKLYTPQIQGPAINGDENTFLEDNRGGVGNFENLRDPVQHTDSTGSATRLFQFFRYKFKNGTEELIKKLSIMNMPILQRRDLSRDAWRSVPDVVGPNQGAENHETLFRSVNIGSDAATREGKAPDIEPQQFFSVVTLIARAIILEKTSLTSFTGHFASIITNAFTSLGDTITGTELGAKLGGGGNSNKDNNFINQKGGVIHYSGDGEFAGHIVAVEAMDWTRDFMPINLEDPRVIGMPLSDQNGYIVSIIQGEIPDAEGWPQIPGIIHIGNSNEQDIWGIHLYKYVRVNDHLDERGILHPIVYKLYPVSQKELVSYQSEIDQYLERAKREEIGKLAQTKNQDEINAIILLSEMPFAEATLARASPEQLMSFGEAAQYVSRALRFAKRAKYTILLRRRNIEQIKTAIEGIYSEEDLTDFTTALCLYNLSANEEADSHKILQFINQSQDALGSKFGTNYETIKLLILELVDALQGDFIYSIIKVNDIVKQVDGGKNRETYLGDLYDADLYDKIDNITEECFYSAYRDDVPNADGSVSRKQTQATPVIKSATILYKEVQDSLLSEINAPLAATTDATEESTYILELYKNSCYLEGIYSLLDNMSNETMLSFIQRVGSPQSSWLSLRAQINDAVAEQLARGAVGCRPSIELLLLLPDYVQTFYLTYHGQIVELDAHRGQRGGGLNITQMIEVLGELRFDIPFLSKDLIDNLALGEGEGDKTKILEFMIMYFNTIYEEMDSMMDWGYVRVAIEQLHQLLSQGVTPEQLHQLLSQGVTPDPAAQLLSSMINNNLSLADVSGPMHQLLSQGVTPDTAAQLLSSLINNNLSLADVSGTMQGLLSQGITHDPAAQLLSSMINNNLTLTDVSGPMQGFLSQGITHDPAAQLLTSMINKGFPPDSVLELMGRLVTGMTPDIAVQLLTSLVNLRVTPEKVVGLLTSMINKGLDSEAINGVINMIFIPSVQLFSDANIAAETMTILIQRSDSLSPLQLSSLFQHAAQIVTEVTPEQFENILKNGNISEDDLGNAIFQSSGGAPKCQPCSTNEVYKPPKKKSIRKISKKQQEKTIINYLKKNKSSIKSLKDENRKLKKTYRKKINKKSKKINKSKRIKTKRINRIKTKRINRIKTKRINRINKIKK